MQEESWTHEMGIAMCVYILQVHRTTPYENGKR